MAFFGVTTETIETSRKHPGADKLSLASLKGMSFQFVTGLNQFQPGDAVLYFPVDSLLPPELQEELGLTGKLAGKDKNRVKTVRLRGEISQGIVGPTSLIAGTMGTVPLDDTEAITRFLGVTKYEPPIVPIKNGKLIRLPEGVSVYDIEGADRYKNVAERMMDIRVNITEKMEGSNFSVTFVDNKFFVNQRNHSIQVDEPSQHDYWRIAKTAGLDVAARNLSVNGEIVTIYGEFLGPGYQGNYYKFKEHMVMLFDIRVGYMWRNPDCFARDAKEYCSLAKPVPVIADNVILRDWLDGRTIQEASNGKSMICDRKREGIVIRPMDANIYDSILGGRLILKCRSPEYLAKTEN